MTTRPSVPSLPRRVVSQPSDGVYLVHELDAPAIEGVAVYRYAGDRWRCERCRDGSVQVDHVPHCEHVQLAQQTGYLDPAFLNLMATFWSWRGGSA